MPSPQVVPTALPTPPSLPRRRSSRNRLQLPQNPAEPPIPPRLIGSPLLHRLTTSPQTQPCYFSEKAQSELWLDGDEFGIGRKENAHLQDIPLPPLPSPLLRVPSTPKRSVRRSPPSSASRRSNSPPPTAKFSSPPPPVPPIPASALASPGSKRPSFIIGFSRLCGPSSEFTPSSDLMLWRKVFWSNLLSEGVHHFFLPPFQNAPISRLPFRLPYAVYQRWPLFILNPYTNLPVPK
ncbi:unnamed protein product [Somion occarium]|uniref:Uncharacterized protein n=1 Tax=Somion occarium TaxID=3059160 RepID=A0ABP1D1K6_9APHY